jgi:hypothetical protein
MSLLSYTLEAEWTPIQTHYFSESLVALGIEPGIFGSVARTLTTSLQRRSNYTYTVSKCVVFFHTSLAQFIVYYLGAFYQLKVILACGWPGSIPLTVRNISAQQNICTI